MMNQGFELLRKEKVPGDPGIISLDLPAEVDNVSRETHRITGEGSELCGRMRVRPVTRIGVRKMFHVKHSTK